MAIALRCLAIAALGLFLLPAVRPWQTRTSPGTRRQPALDDHRRPAAQPPTTSRSRRPARATSSRSTRPASRCPTRTANCTGAGTTQVTCTRAARASPSTWATLQRHLQRRPSVTVPISVAGGAGNDTLNGGPEPDVLVRRRRQRHAQRARRRRRLLRRDRQRHDRGARRERGADLLRRRHRLRPQRLHRRHRRVRDAASTATATASAPASTATTPIAAIFPGAREIFANGIDENCNGLATTSTSTSTATASRARPTATTTTRRSGPTRSRSAATRSTRTATACASPWLRAAGGRVQPLGGRPELHAAARADPAQPAARGEDHVQLRRQLVPVPQDQAADRALDRGRSRSRAA